MRVNPVGYLETGVLYCDDNLERLTQFPPACVDLVYLDPPFFSNRNYEVIWGDEAEIRSFEDRWEGGIDVYISWMKDRMLEVHRVLKDNGSVYLHCDSTASHYLKVMLDSIFGFNNCRNEIIWKRANSHNDPKRFGRISDTILYYGKSQEVIWNPQYTPYREEYYASHFKKDADGRWYRTVPLDAPKHGAGSPSLLYDWKGKWPAKTRTWAVQREKLEEYESEGRIKYTRTGTPTLLQYADEMPGVPLQNIWTDIPPVNPQARERIGYPTQKPEALLERIITASSNPGDIVLDPFCGCGTTIAVAERLKRQWVGIDISPTAVNLMRRRVLAATNGAVDARLIGMPASEADLKSLKPFEFQNWIMQQVNGTPSPQKTGDMGIDGLSFMYHEPIQVKQSEKVGRPKIDEFFAAIKRTDKGLGYLIAFSFTSGARNEVARLEREEGIKIVLVSVAELLLATEAITRPGGVPAYEVEKPSGWRGPSRDHKRLLQSLLSRQDLPPIEAPPRNAKPSGKTLVASERASQSLTD
jgi:DNA modification methylase